MKLLAILSMMMVLVTACTPTTKPKKEKVYITKDHELYLQHCANCHGGNLEGSFGPSLNKLKKKYSEAEVLTIIQEGKGSMPAQDYISEEEQKKLAQWLLKR